MNSRERHEVRYQRRKLSRENKRLEKFKNNLDYEWVFSPEHLYASYKKCIRKVRWKTSTQKFMQTAPSKLADIHSKLMTGTFRSPGFYEFDINERGKTRHIRSIKLSERIVQRCLCDYCLVPILSNSLIYDNGASIKNKGQSFTVKRLKRHLEEHYKEYGNEGYILLFDYSKYFDSIPHENLFEMLDRYVPDERLNELTKHFVSMFGDVGVGLGSQVSQILSVAYPNYIDHQVKERLHIKGYGRYMDDGHMIHLSKEYLRYCLWVLKCMSEKLGLKLNEKKTQIAKLSHGFTFMQGKYKLNGDGTVLHRIGRKSVTRMRRRIKVYAEKMNEGLMTGSSARDSLQAWLSYAKQFHAYKTIQSIGNLYDELIIYRRRPLWAITQ